MDPNLRYLVDFVRDAMVVFHCPSGPGSRQCGGCGEPIRRDDDEIWRSTLTDSGVCTGTEVDESQGWEFVTDCETAGLLAEAIKASDKGDDLPLRSHLYLPMGYVVAINRDAFWPRSTANTEAADGGLSDA